MKRKKSLLVFLCMLVFVLALPLTANAAQLNKKSAVMVKGTTMKLVVKGTKKIPVWSSSRKDVAIVNAKGKVRAKKAGTTYITAKIGKKKYSCKVLVQSPVINKTDLTLYAGSRYQLKLRKTTLKAKWYSDDTDVATVNQNGVVTAKHNGEVYITATVQGEEFACFVTVKKKKQSTNKKKTEEPEPSGGSYLLNTHTGTFHDADCGIGLRSKYSVSTSLSRSQLIARGYHPCGVCNP